MTCYSCTLNLLHIMQGLKVRSICPELHEAIKFRERVEQAEVALPKPLPRKLVNQK